jgi:hypothetical protein
MHTRRTLRRRIGTILGILGLAAAMLTAAPAAYADDTAPVELPRFIGDGMNHTPMLQAEVNYWNVARIAKWGLNFDGADAFPPPGGWDDLSKPWTGQGGVSRTVGKVMMVYRNTLDGDIVHSSCSANVVTSANKSTIVAAGHCFKVSANIRGGIYGDDVLINAVFIPGFDGRNLARYTGTGEDTAPLPGTDVAPYGVWGLTRAWITPTWDADSTFRSGGDVAMATVERPGDPTRIQDVTGGQNIAFGVSANPLSLHQFGYPTDNSRNWYWSKNSDGTYNPSFGVDPSLRRGFDGRTLMYAKGVTIGDSTVGLAHDMASAMSPGSSGGPWLLNFDPATGTGTQIAVTSRFTNSTGDSPWWDAINMPVHGNTPNWGYGPYLMSNGFGDLTQAMYNVVQHATL